VVLRAGLGLTWAWWLPLAVAGRTVTQGDGWPTHFPGLLGPALAALLVTVVTVAVMVWAVVVVVLAVRANRRGVAVLAARQDPGRHRTSADRR
jgi:hypothetical protein